MKHLSVIAIMMIFFALSCESPSEFVADNPLDPDNPDYEAPLVTIISGPTEGEIINSSEAAFGWEGNAEGMQFRFRRDGQSWSDWGNATAAVLYYLDEGAHTFALQGKYISEDTSAIARVTFIVDAVTGPALMFYPRAQAGSQGSTVPFMIMAEEVSNLAAAEFTITFDPTELQIVDITEGTFFGQNGETIFISAVDNTQGSATVSAGLWGGSTPSVAGSGGLAVFLVQIIKQGSFTIGFDGTEVLKTPENTEILVLTTVNGLVVVQ